jgi:heme A synthase
MRYPDNIPAEQLTRHASDDMLLFTAALAILIGIILTYLGKRGKQQWMIVWSLGLIICSVLMAGSILT